MTGLGNLRHERFCQLVAAGHSPAQAYVAAGYSEKTAYTSGPRLLKMPAVNARVAELRQAVAQGAVNRAVIDREWVLSELRQIAENGVSESARVRALELVGKELGMFTNSSDLLIPWDGDLSKLSDRQVEGMTNFFLRQEYGDDVAAIEARKRQALIDAGAIVIEAESTAVSRTQP
jgi:DNA-binding CsgD family transcriptional regulator